MSGPDEHDLTEGLKRIEGRLLGWAPSSPQIERDRLLFEAGRAASLPKAPRISWPLATAATALLALGAAWGWAQEHSKRQAVEVELAQSRQARPSPVSIDSPRLIASRDPGPLDPSSYMALSRRLSASGELGEAPAVDIPAGVRPRPDESTLTPNRIRSSSGRIDL